MTTPNQQLNHLVIEGMKHCGKSTHGRALAHTLGWNFFDTDELIVEGFSRQLDRPLSIRDVFNMLGQEKFEAFEKKMVEGLYEKLKNSKKRCVIALGGRPPTYVALHPILKAIGKVVYLRVPTDLLFKRATRRGPLPFLNPDRPQDHFEEICEDREDKYLAIADLVIDIPDNSVYEAQQLVIKKVKETFADYIGEIPQTPTSGEKL